MQEAVQLGCFGWLLRLITDLGVDGFIILLEERKLRVFENRTWC